MDRDHLPSAVKRAVRQRCGFGCVMCGSPVFDYEHIEGYAHTGHNAEQMTLLCPEHHREKTAGRLPVSLVRKANAAPFNSAPALSKAQPLYFEGSSMDVLLGSVYVQTDGLNSNVVEIDREAVMKVDVEEGRLVLGMILRDADNRPLLVVQKGQLKYALSSWDVVFEGTTLTIRRGPGDIVFRMKLRPPDGLTIERAEWWSNGVFLKIGKTSSGLYGIELMNSGQQVIGGTYTKCRTALGIATDMDAGRGAAVWLGAPVRWLGGVPAEPGAFSKYGGGQIVSSGAPWVMPAGAD